MSSWNRSSDPHASAFPSSETQGSPSGAGIAPWTTPERVPSWLRPFTLDANTRFTRTPDVFLRPPKAEAHRVPESTMGLAPAPQDPDMQTGLQDRIDELAASGSAPSLTHAPSLGLADTARDLADTMDDDDILIDWTGGAWAARAMSEEADLPRSAPHAVDPVRLHALDAGAVEEPVGFEPPAPTADLPEPLILRRRLAQAISAPVCDPHETIEQSADEIPAIASVTHAVDMPQPVALAPELAPETDEPALLLPSQEADAPVLEVEPALEAEAALDLDTELNEVPERLRRLSHLIVIAPRTPPRAAQDQDLVAPQPEPEILDIPTEADTGRVEALEALEAQTLASDACAPCELEAEPVAETGTQPVGEELPPAAGLPDMLQARTLRVTFNWPMFGSAAPTPASPLPAASCLDDHAQHAPEAEAPHDVEEPEPAQALEQQGATALEAAPEETHALAPDPAPEATAPRMVSPSGYWLPDLDLLAEPPMVEPAFELSEEALDRNSTALQQTLRDFGVRGEVIDANPGPVVTLYEFEPAPGTKSSRVIGLSADIARSMSAVSARVAVVEGRNVIGIELPNQRRETVWLRELMASHAFSDARAKLGLCLGKTIGGEPVIADLARMPHLLVAGTTGSGKSVAINTMILSLLYRLTPEQCRLIMIDPKMLELSVYEGIPHLLTPVVTDPKKAIIALQWAVREMEDRYRKMSRLKVRNIEGFNARVTEAREKGEVITCTVQTGFDKETGEVNYEDITLDLTSLPYIVIIVDEMADLMMVAGKDIEGAIQRLAQMARAAGIHLVMATQRPSVDVITGTIKANFPTRISFQVTSKIDSRTILGEMGAEALLGQGDMLYMANGGRITRVHGPFVSDVEVEHVVAHLKAQGRPEYLEAVTSDDDAPEEADEDSAVFDKSALAEESGDHYDQAVAIVLRDRKASTSYIQRRLQIGYNKAASLMERMENEGIVGPANHAGKREILSGRPG